MVFLLIRAICISSTKENAYILNDLLHFFFMKNNNVYIVYMYNLLMVYLWKVLFRAQLTHSE